LNSSEKAPHTGPAKVILISMPWALFNRPSIQLGTLKAYLESRSKEFSVATSHPYLEVASILKPDLYHWISQNHWVSEALYAPQLFPEQAAAAEVLALKYVKKADKKIKRAFHYRLLVERLEKHLKKWARSYDWTQYKVMGFSVCFHQLFASLAAARAIKKNHPQATIVLGGSSCGADIGQSLLNAFDFIDYVIEGEGERGFLDLCASVSGLRANALPENIITRQGGRQDARQKTGNIVDAQVPSLEDLPVPEYSDYFTAQKKWFSPAPFVPILPIEFSRGCWWNKCSFCNLNVQWCGYRYKKAAQMLHEVKTLAARHNCLDFTFVDNMLPPAESLHFFKMSGKDHSDFNFFAEIRSAKGDKPLADIFPTYRRGGLSSIQVGIEAFSSSLLQKMKKGISAIENIATMRGAQENSLKLEGNLILQFPGSSQAEVAETLAVLDYVFPYPPLAIAAFFLGHDSPIYKKPHQYGIKAIVCHPNNFKLFPKSILTQINLLIKDYRGDRVHQRKIWKPVLQKIKKWQQYHEERKQDALQKPLLYYRDGGDFLLIRQELSNRKILYHRLKGTSRQIYLFCTHIRTEKGLCEKFPAVPPQKILSFLAELDKKRLLFTEKNKYLALAIHFRD
jgi:ribosomal peptide maturation radical SAM protein 1